MNLETALGTESLRLVNHTRWLVYEEDDRPGEWVVYDRPKYAKHTKTLIRTQFVHEAVHALIND